ncbi:hypothetical protein [Nostocoides sp. Soil756]|uniref:hypothetical protein n=1 Tax=Nostocoides sp. Soil756 TaxID=1736399 RepID=UPI000ABF7ECD|nr:hypothetical protein [Tetrasphaera sp. Soil756]
MSVTPAARTAPDTASGAVPAHPQVTVPPVRGRDFWRAVVADVLATLAPWPR